MKTIIVFALCLLCAANCLAIETAIKIKNGGIQFPIDGSIQYKDATPHTCADGEVLISKSGSWFCGSVNPTNFGLSTCIQGLCSISACLTGHGDCDGLVDTGCEANLLNDSQHCGACGTACSVSGTCTSGICTYPPHLVSLLPNPSYVAVGRSIYMTAALSAPALGDTFVTLSADIPLMATVDPPYVTILNGQTQSSFPVTAYSAGSVTITASLNGNNITGQVIVLDDPCLSNPCSAGLPPSSCLNGSLTTYPSGICSAQGAGGYTCSYPSNVTACPSGLCQGDVCKP